MSCWTTCASVGVHKPDVLPWHFTQVVSPATVQGWSGWQQPAPLLDVPGNAEQEPVALNGVEGSLPELAQGA